MKLIIILIILLLLTGCSTETTTNTECPSGLTNDPYPGSCGQYQDTNNNEICDLSEK